MRAQPQPGDLLRGGGELTAQADARWCGQAGRLLHLNLQAHFALRVEPVAFTAEKRQPALCIPAVQHANLHGVRQTLGFCLLHATRHSVVTGRFPALRPGVGIDAFRFAGADVVVQRRADKAVL